jgi:hypothetical protein
MPYLTCPQCHAGYRAGALYVRRESCPRCGTPFAIVRRGLRDHLASTVLRRRQPEQALDWEAITGSQYTRRQSVSSPERNSDLDRSARARESRVETPEAGGRPQLL